MGPMIELACSFNKTDDQFRFQIVASVKQVLLTDNKMPFSVTNGYVWSVMVVYRNKWAPQY